MATVTVTRSDRDGFLDVRADGFEVSINQGESRSPRSIELVLLGLGACTVATVRHYMQRKGMPVSELGVEVASELDEKTNSYGDFKITLSVGDDFTESERQVLLQIAKTCRIHKTMISNLEIDIALSATAEEMTRA